MNSVIKHFFKYIDKKKLFYFILQISESNNFGQPK